MVDVINQIPDAIGHLPQAAQRLTSIGLRAINNEGQRLRIFNWAQEKLVIFSRFHVFFLIEMWNNKVQCGMISYHMIMCSLLN